VLAFHVRYLLGRVASADLARGSDKDRVEWPPHPDRLFCALVQAWSDLGHPTQERDLLVRLESPLEERTRLPVVHVAQTTADVSRVSFVPVNDNWRPYYRDPNTNKDKAFPVMGSLRIGRDRKERRFVSRTVDLDPPEAHAIIGWPGDGWTASDYESAAKLARLVGYLGHSSSVVAVEVADHMPTPTWVAAGDGTLLLRVPTTGRLGALQGAFKAGRRPAVGAVERHGRAPARRRPPPSPSRCIDSDDAPPPRMP
jgi:CRISPR-associated protein Csb2